MFSGFTESFSGTGLLQPWKKDIWNASQVTVIVSGITTWHLLVLKETHFFQSTINLAVLLWKKLGERVLREEGHARPGAATSIPLAKTMWSPDADNCYQLLAVNVPEYPNVGEPKKKKRHKIHFKRLRTHIPRLQQPLPRHSSTPFSLHTLVTLSFFAYRTGSAHLLQLQCCPCYRTTDTALHTSRNIF